MDVLQGLQYLVNYVFPMNGMKYPSPDGNVQIRFHEVEYHIEILLVHSRVGC
jgi:hypothetical protein